MVPNCACVWQYNLHMDNFPFLSLPLLQNLWSVITVSTDLSQILFTAAYMVPNCACVYKRGVPRLAPLWWWNLKKKNLGGNNDAANLFTSQFNNQTYKRCTCKMYIYMYPTCCHTCKYHCVTLLWRMNWWVILSQDEYTACVFVEMTCQCYLPSLPLSHILLKYHNDRGLLLCMCLQLATDCHHETCHHETCTWCLLCTFIGFNIHYVSAENRSIHVITSTGYCLQVSSNVWFVCSNIWPLLFWTFDCLFRPSHSFSYVSCLLNIYSQQKPCCQLSVATNQIRYPRAATIKCDNKMGIWWSIPRNVHRTTACVKQEFTRKKWLMKQVSTWAIFMWNRRMSDVL